MRIARMPSLGGWIRVVRAGTFSAATWLSAVTIPAFAQHVHFEVPEDSVGRAHYITSDEFESAKEHIVTCVYHGSAQWLVDQKDARSRLHELPRLRCILLLQHNVTIEELKYLATVKTLDEVWLGDAPEGVSVSEEAIKELAATPLLGTLHLCVHGLCESHLQPLRNYKDLTDLTIMRASEWQWTHANRPDDAKDLGELTDSCAEHIVAVKALKSLDVLGNRWLTDNFVEKISELPSLRSLSIDSPLLTDESLRVIAENMRLEDLSISSPKFTNEGVVKWLSQAKTLRNLQIHSPCLTGEAFALVESLPLRSVIINGNRKARVDEPRLGENDNKREKKQAETTGVTDKGGQRAKAKGRPNR